MKRTRLRLVCFIPEEHATARSKFVYRALYNIILEIKQKYFVEYFCNSFNCLPSTAPCSPALLWIIIIQVFNLGKLLFVVIYQYGSFFQLSKLILDIKNRFVESFKNFIRKANSKPFYKTTETSFIFLRLIFWIKLVLFSQ